MKNLHPALQPFVTAAQQIKPPNAASLLSLSTEELRYVAVQGMKARIGGMIISAMALRYLKAELSPHEFAVELAKQKFSAEDARDTERALIVLLRIADLPGGGVDARILYVGQFMEATIARLHLVSDETLAKLADGERVQGVDLESIQQEVLNG